MKPETVVMDVLNNNWLLIMNIIVSEHAHMCVGIADKIDVIKANDSIFLIIVHQNI